MKNFKRVLICVFTLAVTLATPLQAYATIPIQNIGERANTSTISLRWANINKISPLISATGTSISAGAYVKAVSSTSKISGTYSIEKKSGSSWSTVKSWSFSGTDVVSVSNSYTGVKGAEYRTKVVATVNGETATSYSSSCFTK